MKKCPYIELSVTRSYLEAVALLRQWWVLDMGAMFEEVYDDSSGEINVVLCPGVWEENLAVLGVLKKNREWWDKYFVGMVGKHKYSFSGGGFEDKAQSNSKRN